MHAGNLIWGLQKLVLAAAYTWTASDAMRWHHRRRHCLVLQESNSHTVLRFKLPVDDVSHSLMPKERFLLLCMLCI